MKKRKSIIKPLYVKNAQGKTTHVYLDINSYEVAVKELKKYEKK